MDTKEIVEFFPQIEQIQSELLKTQCIEAFRLAIAEGGWNAQTVPLAPIGVGKENCPANLIEHVRAVADLCMAGFDRLSQYHKANGVAFERDIVLCGALLHDIGKFVEYEFVAGKTIYSKRALLLRHPLAGALIASKAGLPDTIVHLIATHSHEGSQSHQTAESSFVRAMDKLAFNSAVFGL